MRTLGFESRAAAQSAVAAQLRTRPLAGEDLSLAQMRINPSLTANKTKQAPAGPVLFYR